MSKSKPKIPLDAATLNDLMEKLQMRPPYLDTDALIANACNKVIEDDGKPKLAKEAAKLEQKIIRIIMSSKGNTLKPNSGQSVEVGENHICIGCTERPESNYRVWQWHGHIMGYDEEKGFGSSMFTAIIFSDCRRRSRRSGLKVLCCRSLSRRLTSLMLGFCAKILIWRPNRIWDRLLSGRAVHEMKLLYKHQRIMIKTSNSEIFGGLMILSDVLIGAICIHTKRWSGVCNDQERTIDELRGT